MKKQQTMLALRVIIAVSIVQGAFGLWPIRVTRLDKLGSPKYYVGLDVYKFKWESVEHYEKSNTAEEAPEISKFIGRVQLLLDVMAVKLVASKGEETILVIQTKDGKERKFEFDHAQDAKAWYTRCNHIFGMVNALKKGDYSSFEEVDPNFKGCEVKYTLRNKIDGNSNRLPENGMKCLVSKPVEGMTGRDFVIVTGSDTILLCPLDPSMKSSGSTLFFKGGMHAINADAFSRPDLSPFAHNHNRNLSDVVFKPNDDIHKSLLARGSMIWKVSITWPERQDLKGFVSCLGKLFSDMETGAKRQVTPANTVWQHIGIVAAFIFLNLLCYAYFIKFPREAEDAKKNPKIYRLYRRKRPQVDLEDPQRAEEKEEEKPGLEEP